MSTYLPTYLPNYLPSYLTTYLPTHVSSYLSIFLSTYLPTYLSNYISIYLLPVCLACIKVNGVNIKYENTVKTLEFLPGVDFIYLTNLLF